MASLDEFIEGAKAFAGTVDEASRQFTEFSNFLAQVESEDPCAEGFKAKLDELNSRAETFNTLIGQTLQPGLRNTQAQYESLGFFDKRSATATAVMNTALNGFRSLRERVVALGGKAKRDKITAAFQACPEKKEGEGSNSTEAEEAKKTDEAAADAPKQSENQSTDDRAANTDTKPNEPNSEGQKEVSTPGPSDTGTTGPGGSTPSESYGLRDLIKINPLSKFSSYTYNVTLYMVTPEAYNSYLTNQEMPKQGVYIIAQSGGMNNTSEARALGLDGTLGPGSKGLDYFIDDIKLDTVYPGKHGMNTATVATKLTFKIYEPQGFGFLPRLARASQEVIKKSAKLQAKKQKPLPFQMMYMMGVRFYGYDENGEIVQSAQPGFDENYGKYGSFERILPLFVQSVRTKLDGRVVTYDWSAVVANEQFAFSQFYGKLNSKASIEAATVGEAIGSLAVENKNSLLGGLNAEQVEQKNKKNIEIPCQYDIEFEPDSPIARARLIDDDEYSKAMAAMMDEVNTTKDSSPKVSIKANSIKTLRKKLEMPQGMSIVNVIDQLITKSTYITESLNKVNNQRIETLSKDKNSTTQLDWFTVHPKVEILDWDTKTNNWAVKITFQVKSYKIPYVRTQYTDIISKYYGPLKEYQYWFTGKNTEVLSYEQTFNSLYYIIQPYAVNDDNKNENLKSTTPVKVDSTPGGNDVVGKANGGSKINETVRDSVYNVVDQYRATVRIMGDPDYLLETVGGSLEFNKSSSSSLFKQFYHKRGSINPYGGQVFCEIVFKISEDYSEQDTGLQAVNDQLTFYGTPEEQKLLKNNGVIYQVIKVESTLRRGAFHQVLNLLIVPPQNLLMRRPSPQGDSSSQAQRNESQAESNRLQRQNSAVAAGLTNQTNNVQNRTGVNLNSQGRTATGTTAQNTTYDTRESPVQQASQVEKEPQTVSGTVTPARDAPLASTKVVTTSSTGSTPNDDAAANTSSPQRVEPSGREETETQEQNAENQERSAPTPPPEY